VSHLATRGVRDLQTLRTKLLHAHANCLPLAHDISKTKPETDLVSLITQRVATLDAALASAERALAPIVNTHMLAPYSWIAQLGERPVGMALYLVESALAVGGYADDMIAELVVDGVSGSMASRVHRMQSRRDKFHTRAGVDKKRKAKRKPPRHIRPSTLPPK
jgi:hypothetical protein